MRIREHRNPRCSLLALKAPVHQYDDWRARGGPCQAMNTGRGPGLCALPGPPEKGKLSNRRRSFPWVNVMVLLP